MAPSKTTQLKNTEQPMKMALAPTQLMKAAPDIALHPQIKIPQRMTNPTIRCITMLKTEPLTRTRECKPLKRQKSWTLSKIILPLVLQK